MNRIARYKSYLKEVYSRITEDKNVALQRLAREHHINVASSAKIIDLGIVSRKPGTRKFTWNLPNPPSSEDAARLMNSFRKRKKKDSRRAPGQSDQKRSIENFCGILEEFLERTSKLECHSEIHKEVEKTVRELLKYSR